MLLTPRLSDHRLDMIGRATFFRPGGVDALRLDVVRIGNPLGNRPEHAKRSARYREDCLRVDEADSTRRSGGFVTYRLLDDAGRPAGELHGTPAGGLVGTLGKREMLIRPFVGGPCCDWRLIDADGALVYWATIWGATP